MPRLLLFIINDKIEITTFYISLISRNLCDFVFNQLNICIFLLLTKWCGVYGGVCCVQKKTVELTMFTVTFTATNFKHILPSSVLSNLLLVLASRALEMFILPYAVADVGDAFAN